MNSFSILVELSKQMYDDIRFIAENNPTQVVDDDTAKMYNALLKEIKLARPSQTTLQFFTEMTARTLKYKDALVVTGQLYRLMSLMDANGASVEELIRRSSSATPKPDLSEDNDSLDESEGEEEDPPTVKTKPVIADEELYGTKSIQMNDDGIVPFDLNDGESSDS